MPGTIEERIASLEGCYQELTKRIDDFRSETHRNFDHLRNELIGRINDQTGRINDLAGQMADLRSESRSNFRWILSLILANWLSLMAGIFLVAARK